MKELNSFNVGFRDEEGQTIKGLFCELIDIIILLFEE